LSSNTVPPPAINVAGSRRDIALENSDLFSMFFTGPNLSTWYSASTRGVTKQVPHHNDAEGNAQHPRNHVAHATLRQQRCKKMAVAVHWPSSQTTAAAKSLTDTDMTSRRAAVQLGERGAQPFRLRLECGAATMAVRSL